MSSDPGPRCEEFPCQLILGLAVNFLVTGWARSYLGVSASIFITVFKSPARGNLRWETSILTHSAGDRATGAVWGVVVVFKAVCSRLEDQ